VDDRDRVAQQEIVGEHADLSESQHGRDPRLSS
jgi:hypothetical protein